MAPFVRSLSLLNSVCLVAMLVGQRSICVSMMIFCGDNIFSIGKNTYLYIILGSCHSLLLEWSMSVKSMWTENKIETAICRYWVTEMNFLYLSLELNGRCLGYLSGEHLVFLGLNPNSLLYAIGGLHCY